MSLLTDLRNYWALDEASGNRADTVGSVTLTDNNSVTSATGLFGTAAEFDASNSEMLTNTTSGFDFYTNDFTINIWATKTVDSSSFIGLFSNRFGTVSNGWITLGTRDRILTLEVKSVTNITASDSFNPHNQGWQMYTITYNATSKVLTLYRNTTSAGTAGAGTPEPGDASNGISIGRWFEGAQHWDGLSQGVGLWTRILDSDEIDELYNSGDGLAYANFGGGPAAENALAFGGGM